MKKMYHAESFNQTMVRDNRVFLRKNFFTLIELLIVIAIIAILSRSKNSFFLLFSAI